MYHTPDKKEIEIICSGNNERSYLGEIVGQKRIEDLGEDHAYKVISSGSAANKLRSGNAPLNFKLKTIHSGLKRGVYEADHKMIDSLLSTTQEQYDNDPATRSAVDHYEEIARTYFAAEGRQHVDTALKKMGLEDKIYNGWNQTTAAPNVEAAFPMAESNINQVKQIYAESEYDLPSIVDSPKAYVTGNPEDQIPNAFGGTKEVFDKMIEEVSLYVPAAIEKVLNTRG